MLGNMKSRLAHVATVGEARCLRPQLAHLPGGGAASAVEGRGRDVTPPALTPLVMLGAGSSTIPVLYYSLVRS